MCKGNQHTAKTVTTRITILVTCLARSCSPGEWCIASCFFFLRWQRIRMYKVAMSNNGNAYAKTKKEANRFWASCFPLMMHSVRLFSSLCETPCTTRTGILARRKTSHIANMSSNTFLLVLMKAAWGPYTTVRYLTALTAMSVYTVM